MLTRYAVDEVSGRVNWSRQEMIATTPFAVWVPGDGCGAVSTSCMHSWLAMFWGSGVLSRGLGLPSGVRSRRL